LARDVAAVVRDVEWGKVSVDGARTDYGVAMTVADGVVTVDGPATDSLRAEKRSRRTGDEPFFDRGPGYARLSGGKAFADVDVL
jgi:N-methylhydantoinase B